MMLPTTLRPITHNLLCGRVADLQWYVHLLQLRCLLVYHRSQIPHFAFLLQKRFDDGICESLAFASQQEFVIRFPKQLKRYELIYVLPEIFQLRSGNPLAGPQPERNPFRTFHFVRQSFARGTR